MELHSLVVFLQMFYVAASYFYTVFSSSTQRSTCLNACQQIREKPRIFENTHTSLRRKTKHRTEMT